MALHSDLDDIFNLCGGDGGKSEGLDINVFDRIDNSDSLDNIFELLDDRLAGERDVFFYKYMRSCRTANQSKVPIVITLIITIIIIVNTVVITVVTVIMSQG